MRKINKTSTRTRQLFISDLGSVIGGGCSKKGKGPIATTLALGEEDGGSPGPIFTTLALGEEDGGLMTTLALGEEDGGAF